MLSSCWKSKGDDEQAMEFAKQAAQLADHIQDHVLLSRTQNNLALYHFARRDFSTALHHLLTAFRATHAIQDFQQQGIVKYHIGLVLSELEIDIELPQSSRTDSTRHFSAAAPGEVTMVEQGNMHGHASRKSLAGAAMTTAKDCFVQSENLAAVLPEQDHVLKVLAHGCRGETEYYAGEFHTAEAEFSIALQRLQEILYPENSASGGIAGTPTASNDADAIGSVDPGELVKIQGFLLSYMGCTQLVEGKFELAEESHQCDLEIALKHEDIHAQLRAMRNLALVYNSTQRYQEAIPLWREALEIACVLQSKVDQMMAYSGLGIAMNELRITDQKGEFKELLDLKENNPLHIFLRQRALAIELGDKNQQIVAQRHIVSTYESLDQPDIEQRLAECDTLVRLSEQYENLQYRSDGYRSLANALTAQLARLSARGARFAEAVQVLTQKRDSVCVKYQQATKTLKMAAAMMLKADDSDATPDARKKPYKEDKHPRPPITRVDMLQRK